MQREFFCCGCGLFHWADQYITDQNTGRIEWNHEAGNCPNPDCISQKRDDVGRYAVDTIGFAYFCESDAGRVILQKKWSSPLYAPDSAIEIYRRQGMRIEIA